MRLLRDAARLLFLCALLYAPWAYGGTTSASIQVINWLLLTAFALWITELVVSGRVPRFPHLLLFSVCVLLVIGSWMALNSKSIYDSDFDVFVPLRDFAPRMPGSVDYAISTAWMLRGAVLLCSILFVVDLSQSNRWLLRLWYTIGLVAGSIAFLGLLQKATGARMIFWQTAPVWGATTFFGTYYYHANAGAFLNLVWPLTAGLALRAFARSSQPSMRALWMSACILALAAVAANTSRVAQLIALLLLIAIYLEFGPALTRKLSRAKRNVVVAGAVAILLSMFAVGWASHLEQPFSRWQTLNQSVPNDSRWLAWRVAIGALPDAGFLGFGPGTFRVVFPSYNSVASSHAPGVWRFLHQDYLQTVLEWGWLGSGIWGLLFFGGMVIAIYSYKNRLAQGWTPRRRFLQPFVIVALAGVALHALVDFPLQIASIQLYVATYLGLCWGSGSWDRRENTLEPS